MTYHGSTIRLGAISWYVRFVVLLVLLLFPLFVCLVKNEFGGTWLEATKGTFETIVEMPVTGNEGVE